MSAQSVSLLAVVIAATGTVAAGALASTRHLKASPFERKRQAANVARLRARLDAAGIPHLHNPSHIVPVMVKDPVKCRMLSDILLRDHGIYVQPINYPTVARGTERLRITPSPLHSDADIDRLVDALGALWRQCALARAGLVRGGDGGGDRRGVERQRHRTLPRRARPRGGAAFGSGRDARPVPPVFGAGIGRQALRRRNARHPGRRGR